MCGQLVTTSITLDSNLGPCPGDGLIVVGDNITINLNGFTISAANGAGDHRAGISIGRLAQDLNGPAVPGGEVAPIAAGSGVTVKNGTVQGFDSGVVIAGVVAEDGTKTGGNTVQNLTIRNNVNDQLSAPCNLGEGVAIFNSDDNRILDNTLTANGPYGISIIEDSDRNRISGPQEHGDEQRAGWHQLPAAGSGLHRVPLVRQHHRAQHLLRQRG